MKKILDHFLQKKYKSNDLLISKKIDTMSNLKALMKNLIILDNTNRSVKIFKSNKENYQNNLEIVCLNY